MKLTDDIMFKALLEKDSTFEGIFFAGIRTTGIFCRPTCTAKKPKRENVEYFFSAKDAIINGYRPCKICSPLEKVGETPEYILSLITELKNDPQLRLKDFDLVQRGIEPNRVRRWFKKVHGITFQDYQRMLRINYSFKKINDGETISSVAYDSGFNSISGFADSFKSVAGVAPSSSKEKLLINSCKIETPIGPMFACASSEGILLLEFTDRRMLESEMKWLTEKMQAIIVPGENQHLDLLKTELQGYFNGTVKTFSVPLVTPGSEFQKSVWKQLMHIPYGTTCSYIQQARMLKRPEAVRAVANANGMNRIAIVIPCHRVIGSDGKLTGYGGGLWRKQFLLGLERDNSAEMAAKGQQSLSFKSI